MRSHRWLLLLISLGCASGVTRLCPSTEPVWSKEDNQRQQAEYEKCVAEHPDHNTTSLNCAHRRMLREAGEPELTPASNAVRLSMISYFRRPLIIRVEFQSDGTADLTATVLERHGHEECKAFRRTKPLSTTAVAQLRDELQQTDLLPNERLLIDAEEKALDAEVEAANKADPKNETFVIRSGELWVYRVLEKAYGGSYSVRQLVFKQRPQFAPFLQLVEHLLALAEVPPDDNDYNY